jgi:inorganic pyrophosphatase
MPTADYRNDVNLLHDLPLYLPRPLSRSERRGGRSPAADANAADDDDADGAAEVRIVVEVPRGSEVKLKYDDELGVFTWSRALPLGVAFPYDFGFLPQTLAGDGDALDALVLSRIPSYPGVVVPARAIGALRVEQQRLGQPVKRNDRVIAVPRNEHRLDELSDIDDVAERTRRELEAFFHASLAMTGKSIRLCGWADAAETAALIAEAAARYQAARASLLA